MQHFCRVACLAFLAVTASLAAGSEESDPLSGRNANYDIEVRLDAQRRLLEGREILRWRNSTEMPATEMRFHLYWNAWKNNRTTWMKEAQLRNGAGSGTTRTVGEEDRSYCRLRSMKILPEGSFAPADVTRSLRHISPDDMNPNDETVAVVSLPRAVEPGETIALQIDWISKIPRTFSRTGYRGDFFFIAHWFPKVGVFREDGTWNCHQFHAGTEFFSDYGVYDVKIAVPRGWLLGATGLAQSVTENSDGTATHHYRQEDVHDFAWTTSPDYREALRVFEHPGLKPVNMRLLYQPEHERQVDRHFRATEAALRLYGEWYGEYPYGHVTIVDPAWGSGAGGMEYPTLFTCGTRFFNPEGGGSPEGVTVHEAGHQFWYGLVGNDEFNHAWLDEGLNTFSTERVMAEAFGKQFYVRRFFRGFVPVMLREVVKNRFTYEQGLDRYRAAARSDAQSTPSYRYHPATGAALSYSKTALWLSMLEKSLGWDVLQRILAGFFERWRFRSPGPADFFNAAGEISGQDLSRFFEQVYGRSAVFDYAVASVSSRPLKAEGFFDREGSPAYVSAGREEARLFETRVVVRRLQDGILPVEVLFKFENGEEERELWDGESEWKLYTVVKPSRLEFAAVDPERKLLLDINYTNNSMLLNPDAGLAASKWAAKWMIWLQDYFQALAFLM